jgi:hypothetical protein
MGAVPATQNRVQVSRGRGSGLQRRASFLGSFVFAADRLGGTTAAEKVGDEIFYFANVY